MKYDYALHLEVENNSHTQIIHRIPAGSSVLELGCATGYMSAWLKQQLNCRVVGVELDAEAAQQAEAHCDRVVQANVEDPVWLGQLAGEQFDVITCADILEHLQDPEALLERLTGCLKPQGVLLASIPNAAHASLRLELLEGRFTYEDTGLLDRTHLHLFTHQAVRSIFTRAGWRVDELSYTFHDMADSVIRERLDRVGLEASDRALAYLHTPEAAAYQFIVTAHPRRAGEPDQVIAELTDKPMQDSLDVFSRLHDELHRTQVVAHEREVLAQERGLEKDRLQRDNRTLHEQNQALERAVAELGDRYRGESEQAAEQRRQLQEHITERQKEQYRLETELVESRHLAETRQQEVEQLTARLREMLGSTSWQVSAPVRWIGRAVGAARQLMQFLLLLLRSPSEAPDRLRKVMRAFRYLGVGGGKRMVQNAIAGVHFSDLDLLLMEPLTPVARRAVLAAIERMPQQPLISILLPTYNTPGPILEQALNSVRGQLYPDWELCIVDDASSEPQVRRVLERFARRDARIRLHFCEQNRGISQTSNRALEMAGGEYVVLMDHDDLLQPQALFRLAQSILADAPDIIYTDEALFAEDRSRILQYHLRPAFSLERLRCHPYIVHLTAFRAGLIREIGGFDANLTISQDYDLILRACERSQTIVHIPEVLYLWRERKASAGFEQQASVAETSMAVIGNHLERCGMTAAVSPGSVFNFYRLDYPLPAGHRVAVIIPTRNHWRLVKQCIDSLQRTVTAVDYELVIVDHASDDPDSLEYFQQLQQEHRVIRVEGPFNFSLINNQAVAELGDGYSHYLFCNNDIEAMNVGWLEHMMGLIGQPDVGIVGAMLLYPDRVTIQHAGVCIGMHGVAEHYGKFMPNRLPDGAPHPGYMGSLVSDLEVSAVTAACMLVKRELFEAVGGFDQALAVGFGDVDLCLKVREQGYRVVMSANAVLLHHESYSRGKSRVDPHPEDSILFRERWNTIIEQGDPFYNPGLTLENTFWSVALHGTAEVDLRRRVTHRRQG